MNLGPAGDIDFQALSRAPTAASLHRSVQDIALSDLRLSQLVRLKAMFRKRISEDAAQSVDIPKAILDACDRVIYDRPLDLPELAAPNPDTRHVSMLTPIWKGGPHLEAVGNFVGFLLSLKFLERLDVVFTAEHFPVLWADDARNQETARLWDVLRASVARFHGREVAPQAFLDKLRVVVAPEAGDLAAAIGDVIIRYECAGMHNQVRMCLRSLFRQRPVLGTVGSSFLKHIPDVDLLLTPANRSFRDNEMHYLRPLQRFDVSAESLKFHPRADGAKVLLTGYAGDKLARGLAKLDEADWAAITGLFQAVPEIHWRLFGAKDVAAVRRAFPAGLLDRFCPRISIEGWIDTTDLFAGGFAFVALPGVGGSGTMAKQALREAVPVLVCLNGERDISNMFPHPAPHKTFPRLIELLTDWATDPGRRADYLAHQLADINIRADLPKKAAEIHGILSRVNGMYFQRMSESTAPPDGQESTGTVRDPGSGLVTRV